MNESKILELAEKAGVCYIDSDSGAAYAALREDTDMSNAILDFARLVAEAERRKYETAIRHAEEWVECGEGVTLTYYHHDYFGPEHKQSAALIDAIRSRTE